MITLKDTTIHTATKKLLRKCFFMAMVLGSILGLAACTDNGVDKPSSTIEHKQDGSFHISSPNGVTLRLTAYGDDIVRVQTKQSQSSFFSDDRYEMVETHEWPRDLQRSETATHYVFSTRSLKVTVDKTNLTANFYDLTLGDSDPLLSEDKPIRWQDSIIQVSFNPDENEHFTGLGHGYFARAESIDLKGQSIERNYGRKQIEQAPLVVPFYMSSKGYGVFLNSMFQNRFNFLNDDYSIQIDGLGFDTQMDYFFIGGQTLSRVLDNYTKLTGRPRLPAKAMFGLQLSDKGHDHNSATPSDETWWKNKISEHKAAGYALDHVVNDNRWRAEGGKRCESKLAWDKERYPNPAAYKNWLDENGLVLTLDFNRCIGQYTDGWQASFNLPKTGKIDFAESAPDLTNAYFRDWFWQAFYKNALAPNKGYPGDALWIDEFDEQGAAPKDMILSNGRSSGEMRNYWFFLIAKSLVQQGWDKAEDINKRPFVWVRGMTAGAQRYATLWSGDIYPNYKDMKTQIRGMQLAGLSGFPFWGHDAGGFHDWEKGKGPDEALYKRWSAAMGSFSPIWKPHGMGQSRWPLDRKESSQTVFKKYTHLRYELMPYLYSAAHLAAETGAPIARAMVLDHQNEALAWKYDLQYMWGDSMLIAPLTSDEGTKELWLPRGQWYAFGSNEKIEGDRVLTVTPALDELPVYVKAGSIITKHPYALSTAFIDKSALILDVYMGANGEATLIEDDGVTEDYRNKDQLRTTKITWNDKNQELTIHPAKGSFHHENTKRDIVVNFYGDSGVNSSQLSQKNLKDPIKVKAGSSKI